MVKSHLSWKFPVWNAARILGDGGAPDSKAYMREHLQRHGLHLPVHRVGRAPCPVDSQEVPHLDSEKTRVLLEVRTDQVPVLVAQGVELTAVQLVRPHEVSRVPHEDRSSRRQGEEVPAGT